MIDFKDFLLWEASTRDTIDFKKIYVDAADDLVSGLMLSEIVYWYLPSYSGRSRLRVEHDGYMWIAVKREEWEDRARITPRQADRAIKILVNRGLVVKKLYKFNGAPTVHVRLCEQAFLERMNELINGTVEKQYKQENQDTLEKDENPSISPNGEMDFDKSVKSISRNGEMDLPESGKSLTETTTETTAENNNTTGRFPIRTSQPSETRKPFFREESHGRKLLGPPAEEYDDSDEEEINEPEYVPDEDTVPNSPLAVPKWKKPKTAFGASVLAVCGRKYYADRSERTNWLEIEKGMMPLDPKGKVRYPTEWVDHCIQYATKLNGDYLNGTGPVKMSLPSLLKYIRNTEKRNDWVSQEVRQRLKASSSPSGDYSDVVQFLEARQRAQQGG